MRKKENLIGRSFERLTAVMFSHKNRHGDHWTCRCSCGEVKVVRSEHLKSGRIKSCGCFQSEGIKQRRETHGLSYHRLYNVYRHIINRCYDSKNISFKNYGGRGITVCDEWINDNTTFFSWAFANGYKDELQIDRINNDGNYEPTNCRFVTAKVNANNRRTSHKNVFIGYGLIHGSAFLSWLPFKTEL